MKKLKEKRKPKDLDLETFVLFMDDLGWCLSCEAGSEGMYPLRPGLTGQALGRSPRIARKIGNWFIAWAEWAEQKHLKVMNKWAKEAKIKKIPT